MNQFISHTSSASEHDGEPRRDVQTERKAKKARLTLMVSSISTLAAKKRQERQRQQQRRRPRTAPRGPAARRASHKDAPNSHRAAFCRKKGWSSTHARAAHLAPQRQRGSVFVYSSQCHSSAHALPKPTLCCRDSSWAGIPSSSGTTSSTGGMETSGGEATALSGWS